MVPQIYLQFLLCCLTKEPDQCMILELFPITHVILFKIFRFKKELYCNKIPQLFIMLNSDCILYTLLIVCHHYPICTHSAYQFLLWFTVSSTNFLHEITSFTASEREHLIWIQIKNQFHYYFSLISLFTCMSHVTGLKSKSENIHIPVVTKQV